MVFPEKIVSKTTKGLGGGLLLFASSPTPFISQLSLHQESLTYLERAVYTGLIHVSFYHYGSLSRKN